MAKSKDKPTKKVKSRPMVRTAGFKGDNILNCGGKIKK